MAGIHTFGGYIPKLRLQRAAAYAATGWFSPGLKSLAKGERSFCAWDEDSITMAVEAARDCLADRDRTHISRVILASTSHSFADRQNSTVVKEALNLRDDVAAFDIAGSKRSATSMLIDAFHAAEGGAGETLCIAAERNVQKPGSEGEFSAGHGAASVLVAQGDGCAKLIASHSASIDFVDHFRKEGEQFDYGWEARWVRDEGYGKIVAATVRDALAKANVDPGKVDHFILGSPMGKVGELVAKGAGIPLGAVADTLAAEMGDAGAAQPLILLSYVLERVEPGALIVLVGFGGGCDVILLETTKALAGARPVRGVAGHLRVRAAVDNYVQYLAFTGLLELDRGMRAELDQKPVLTAQYRDRKAVLGLVGGKCSKTGTIQFPKTPVSVSRTARMIHTQEDYPLAERCAKLITFTSDYLAYTPAPPALYGNIEFDGGGRMIAELRDVQPDSLEIGMPLRMVFRIKAIDERRGYSQYFWKAVPDSSISENS